MALKSKYQEDTVEAGCDEVGRGCLAGPVVAAAVILPPDFAHGVLNDSKKLSSKQRKLLEGMVKERALAWGIGVVDNQEIDEINILNASFLAMHRAIESMSMEPELLLIDGNRFNPYKKTPHKTIIKGDSKFYSIAAASILAKTYRDELMEKYAEKFPHYGWEKNVGYPTKFHRQGIKEYGITSLHRRSFRLLPRQLEVFD